MIRTVSKILMISTVLLAWAPGVSAAEQRLWLSADGRFRIGAELVEQQGGMVTLRRPDGQLVQIQISQLSSADVAYLRQQQPAPAAQPANRPAPAAGELREVPAIESPQFAAMAKAYWKSQQAHETEKAAAVLQGTAGLTLSDADQKALAQLKEHAAALTEFWRQFVQGTQRLPAGAELRIGEEVVAVVESEGGRLVVRALGRNCRFNVAQTTTIPAKLAIAVVNATTRGTDALVQQFAALESNATDPQRWQVAAGGMGPQVPFSDLLQQGNPPQVGRPPSGGPSPLGVSPAPLAPKPPPSEKLAMPAAEAREQAKRDVQELFGKEIDAARSGAQKFELAKKFVNLADQTYPQESASCFVMVQEAGELAAAAGHAIAAFEAADWILARYQIDDPLKVRAAYLTKGAKSATDPNQGAFVAKKALDLATQAAAAGKGELSETLLNVALAGARASRSRELLQQVADHRRTMEEAQAAEREVTELRQTLAANPDDPAANLKLGLYHAALKGEWPLGLPHLAKGDDAALAAAAKADLAAPADGPKQLETADLWWTAAEGAKNPQHQQAWYARAAHWYEQALPHLSGLAKLKAEKRLQQKKG